MVCSLSSSCCRMQDPFLVPLYKRVGCCLLNRGGDFKPFAPYREIFKSPTIRSSKSSEDTQPFIAGLGWVMFQGKKCHPV